MRKIVLISFAIFSGIAAADQVKNQAELALLPPYCRGTQQLREISKDPKPIEEYLAIYGKPYSHLHHYCWALNAENKAWRISDKFLRESKLGQALGDIKYSLDRSGPDFVFLPEIYNSQARILFTLHRDPEAVLALNKAIAAKPDYVPAYLRLSDYFVDKGDKANAIKILEQGIDNTEKADALIKKLAKFGKTYQGVPGHARKKETPPDSPSGEKPNDGANPAENTPPDLPVAGLPDTRTEADKKANPYCQFCP